MAERISAAAAAAGEDLQIFVGSHAFVPSSATYVLFQVEADRLGRLSEREHCLLRSVEEATDLGQFASAIASLEGGDFDWHWVDVVIGTKCTLDPDGADGLHSCGAMLSYFRDWMPSG